MKWIFFTRRDRRIPTGQIVSGHQPLVFYRVASSEWLVASDEWLVASIEWRVFLPCIPSGMHRSVEHTSPQNTFPHPVGMQPQRDEDAFLPNAGKTFSLQRFLPSDASLRDANQTHDHQPLVFYRVAGG